MITIKHCELQIKTQAENILTTFSKIFCLREVRENSLFSRIKLKFLPHEPGFDSLQRKAVTLKV